MSGLAPVASLFRPEGNPDATSIQWGWENISNRSTTPDQLRQRPDKQRAEVLGRRLSPGVACVYDKCCRIGGTLTLDDLAETSGR